MSDSVSVQDFVAILEKQLTDNFVITQTQKNRLYSLITSSICLLNVEITKRKLLHWNDHYNQLTRDFVTILEKSLYYNFDLTPEEDSIVYILTTSSLYQLNALFTRLPI